MQTYIIALPILLGYIVWLLQEQKKKQVQDAKERDERIAEERKKRDANSAGTMLLLRVQLIEYHGKYMKLGKIRAMLMKISVRCMKHIIGLAGMA